MSSYAAEKKRREEALTEARLRVNNKLNDSGIVTTQPDAMHKATVNTSLSYADDADGFEILWRAIGESLWPSDVLKAIQGQPRAMSVVRKYGGDLSMGALLATFRSDQFSAFRFDIDFLSVIHGEFCAFKDIEQEIQRHLVREMRMRFSGEISQTLQKAEEERRAEYEVGFTAEDMDEVFNEKK